MRLFHIPVQVLTISVALLTVACGEDHRVPSQPQFDSDLDKNQPESTSSYSGSYEYEVAGCNTGKHFYRSRDQFCKMLLDEALNRSCALEVRQRAHQQYCIRKRNPDGRPRGATLAPGVKSIPTISLMGPLDRSIQMSSSVLNGIQTTRLEGSFRIATLGFGLGSSVNASIAMLDLNAGQLEISGQPSGCRWSHQFSTVRDRTPSGRFLISLEESAQSGPTDCRAFLSTLQQGFVASVKGARFLSRSTTPEIADVTLVFY